jgi:hypothetical protein
MSRKVDIAARMRHLDAMLTKTPRVERQQLDERAALIEQCRLAGDHVPEFHVIGTAHVANSMWRCQFCRVQMTTTANQLSRNLLTTR